MAYLKCSENKQKQKQKINNQAGPGKEKVQSPLSIFSLAHKTTIKVYNGNFCLIACLNFFHYY